MNDHNKAGPQAEAAWQAWVEMGQSKRLYFNFLRELDEKYDRGDSPSIAENLKMEKLLAEHDRNVKRFNRAMGAVSDPDEREVLMKKLSEAAAGFEIQ